MTITVDYCSHSRTIRLSFSGTQSPSPPQGFFVGRGPLFCERRALATKTKFACFLIVVQAFAIACPCAHPYKLASSTLHPATNACAASFSRRSSPWVSVLIAQWHQRISVLPHARCCPSNQPNPPSCLHHVWSQNLASVACQT